MGLAHMAARAAGIAIADSRPGRTVAVGSALPGPARLARFAEARRAVEGYAAPKAKA